MLELNKYFEKTSAYALTFASFMMKQQATVRSCMAIKICLRLFKLMKCITESSTRNYCIQMQAHSAIKKKKEFEERKFVFFWEGGC